MTDMPVVGSQWVHLKRGTQYAVIALATLQIEADCDNEPCVVYRCFKDGSYWVRPVSEFTDGRFRKVG